MTIHKVIDLLDQVKDNDNSQNDENDEEVGAEELLDYVPIEYLQNDIPG